MISHKDSFASLTPDHALQLLKDGNDRFRNNLSFNRNYMQQVQATSGHQNPFAAVLSCMDSRAPAELIFDQGIGDIFSIRVAGNVISDHVLGSLEYAVAVAESKLIVVMGHTHCGAVKGACDAVEMGHLTGLLHQIGDAVELVRRQPDYDRLDDDGRRQAVSVCHVYQSAGRIATGSEIIRKHLDDGAIRIVPALYDVVSGRVCFFESSEQPVEASFRGSFDLAE